jgi:peptidase YpeB-like protein
MVTNRKKLIIGGIAALAAIGFGAGAAIAQGEDDRPLRGTSRERATKAALEHVGGGTVTETEVGDDGAAYGVEVRLSDGRQVEVQIDENFSATGVEQDDGDED